MQSDKGAGKRKKEVESKIKTNDEQDGPSVKLKVQETQYSKLNNNTTKYQTILFNNK